MAMVVAAPASASSAFVCPNTSRWYLQYVPDIGYGLDAVSYAELTEWSRQTGVPVPSTATFTYTRVNNGIFWTRGAVIGHSADPTGVTSIPYDASAGPETTALVFSGGNVVGSLAVIDKLKAQVDANIQSLRDALPVPHGAVWERQESNVRFLATATLTFGGCTATFTQAQPPR